MCSVGIYVRMYVGTHVPIVINTNRMVCTYVRMYVRISKFVSTVRTYVLAYTDLSGEMHTYVRTYVACIQYRYVCTYVRM